jgi:hypothetical protein
MLLWVSRSDRKWRASGDGLLPLSILPLVVGGAGKRLFVMAARRCPDHQGQRTCAQLQEDGDERSEMVRPLRRTFADRAPALGRYRRVRGYDTRIDLRAGRPRQLRRHCLTYQGRPSKAERLSSRNGWFGAIIAGVRREFATAPVPTMMLDGEVAKKLASICRHRCLGGQDGKPPRLFRSDRLESRDPRGRHIGRTLDGGLLVGSTDPHVPDSAAPVSAPAEPGRFAFYRVAASADDHCRRRVESVIRDDGGR